MQNWRHLASRCKASIHRATTPRSVTATPGVGIDDGIAEPAAATIDLLFPHGVHPDADGLVRSALADGITTSAVRRALGVVDRQTSPSPFTVRMAPDDIRTIDVEGVELVLDIADRSVSAEILRDGYWEPHVTKVLRDLLAPGHVFVDVGANVGYHTALGAALVGPTGRVDAFEPNPENARLLALTIDRNALSQVRLLPVALGATTGHVVFRSAIGSNGSFTEPRSTAIGGLDPNTSVVPTLRLDDLQLNRLDVMKVDVEGAEPHVFDGAAETIERLAPAIVFEFSREMTTRIGGVDPRAHLDRLRAWGYRIHLIDRATGSTSPIDDLDRFLDTWGHPGRIEDLVALSRTGSADH